MHDGSKRILDESKHTSATSTAKTALQHNVGSIDARGECGGAEFVCAWRAHLRLNYVALAPYLITTNRNRRRIARNARKKQQCKHNTARVQAFACGGGVNRNCGISTIGGADER